MNRVVKICLFVAVAIISIQATCGKAVKPFTEQPVQVMKVADHVYFHNVSITYNGNHYFTINGGNENYCKINEYDSKGIFIKSYDVGLDGRAIFYNNDDGKLYVKIFGSYLYSVNLEEENAEVELSFVFAEDNSSPAISPDGKYIYEFIDGNVRVLDFGTGKELNTFRIENYYFEYGYDISIAVSDKYLFVWGDENKILAYDFEGKFISEINLPRNGYGFSLSYCNDMLWFAEDANASEYGGNGYWYGYDLSGRYTTRAKAVEIKEIDSASPK